MTGLLWKKSQYAQLNCTLPITSLPIQTYLLLDATCCCFFFIVPWQFLFSCLRNEMNMTRRAFKFDTHCRYNIYFTLTMKATRVSETDCPFMAHSCPISRMMFFMTLSAWEWAILHHQHMKDGRVVKSILQYSPQQLSLTVLWLPIHLKSPRFSKTTWLGSRGDLWLHIRRANSNRLSQ